MDVERCHWKSQQKKCRSAFVNVRSTYSIMENLDDLLQVPPGLLQGLHGEPGVGIGHHLVALDLLVQFCQLVKVGLS